MCHVYVGSVDYVYLFLGGIPGDHLIVPVSGHGVPSPMHLRLGQKNVWTEEYVNKEEDGRMDRVEAIDAEEEEAEEEHYLDGEDKCQFEGRDWDNEEEEERDDEDVDEEGDKDELKWEIAEFPPKFPQQPYSQHQYYKPLPITEDSDVPVKDPIPQTHADMFRPHLGRSRGQRRLRHWQHLRSHRSVSFRLTQHWKSWRLRAQWLCSQGHRYHQRWQRHSLYGKRKAIKRHQQSSGTDGKDDCVDENIAGYHGGIYT